MKPRADGGGSEPVAIPHPAAAGPPRNVLLSGDLRRTVFVLALPVLCEQLLSYLVGLTDTWLSGRISSEATSAIGLGAYVGWLASLMFSFVGIGTTALVARHWGAGEFEDASRITNRSLALAAVIGVVFYALLYPLAPLLARLLEMHGETGRIVVRYLRLDGLGHLFTSVTLVGAAALRGVGDMRTPMFVLGLVNVLNAAVSAALVFGVGPWPAIGLSGTLVPSLGIDGIVAGTVVARCAGGVLIVAALARGGSGLVLDRRQMRIRGRTVRRILNIGGPAGLEGAMMWFGHFVFLMIIARLETGGRSSALFAAHMIGIRVEAVTYLPAVAWGAAAATLIGQSLGAGNEPRARRIGHVAALQCSLLAAAIAVGFFFGARAIYSVMHSEADVVDAGVGPFRLLAFFQVPLVWSIVYVSALHGAGDTRWPLLFTVIGVFAVRLPVAWLCGIVWEGGLLGAWLGMCLDVTVRGVLALIRYARGRWVQTRV
ncbi:MAG: MATE family efflux transporter [Planctomycetes bacterium]|nr:MATE family efflux transporter [Planctomycetota bacterium]